MFYFVFRRRFEALSLHDDSVHKARLWDFLFYVTFGIVISFSVAIAGVLMVFSALVIPAVVAFLFTSRFLRALLLAWVVGTVALVTGVLASFTLDVATGPLLVCTFGLMLVVALLVRWGTGIRPGSKLSV